MRKVRSVLVLLLSLTVMCIGCSSKTNIDEPHEVSKEITTGSLATQASESTYNNPYEIIEVTMPESDPYATVSAQEFYSDYKPATDYWDAFYRTQHGFMSGSIDDQDQKPTIADERPSENGVLIRNTSSLFSYDGRAYTVLDPYGDVAFTVYEGGGYVTLEEVAAYVYAFGDIPANYLSAKKGSPTSNHWGKYLRCNNSAFSGDTSKYPYEPILPNISGCGGDLYYYEIDIGTTGTDCDPKYTAYPYNDGTRITRGAARIVYARYDADRNEIIDPNERYLFYTYNHYNDFQEYLNYEGGWGDMFGNITGGGSISSKTNYNPTQYIPVLRQDFRNFNALSNATIKCIFWIHDKSDIIDFKYYI